MIVFVILDRIQHLFWKYLVPGYRHYDTAMGSRVRERVMELYAKVDQAMGRLADSLPADTTLLLCSDHGFGGTHWWFNVNRWLEQEGLLRLVPSQRLKKRVFSILMSLNDRAMVKRLVPPSLQSFIRGRVRATRSTFKTDVLTTVDWERTKAFFASIPSQGIYLNRPQVPEGEREELRARLREGLLSLRDPMTGQAVVDRVMFPEEIYQGPQTQFAPDVLFVARDYSVLGRQLFGMARVLDSSLHTPNGFHRVWGIFGAFGPHVRAGSRVEGAVVHDVTATVLAAMDVPIPASFDGRPLDVFSPSFTQAHPPRVGEAEAFQDGQTHQYTGSEERELEERLRRLGYLG